MPLLYFSASKSEMELISRRVIEELEGDSKKNLHLYMDDTTPQYSFCGGLVAGLALQ